MLELKEITKKFGKKEILKGISYAFGKGVYGLLGPNGAGKTTLLRCITDLYPLSGGKILFNGNETEKDPGYKNNIGYLPQKFGLFKELTVREMLETLALLKEIKKENIQAEVERCVALVNLSDRLDDRVKTLSGGMVRRLGIAQAVLGSPPVILLDEPTSGLDPEERIRFKNIIASLEDAHTILISTHIVEDVEALCDQVLIMNEGKIVNAGTCAEIQACARGKVYELEETDENLLKEPFSVQHRIDRNGKKMIRILSGVAQNGGSIKETEPGVEDGYICTLKNI